MKLKRAVLAELGRDELKEIVEQLELDGVDRRSAEAMREAIGRSRLAAPANFFWKTLERRRRGERRLGQAKYRVDRRHSLLQSHFHLQRSGCCFLELYWRY